MKTVKEQVKDYMDSCGLDRAGSLRTLADPLDVAEQSAVEQLEQLEHYVSRVDVIIADRNKLINLQRVLYTKGFEDTLTGEVDFRLMKESDEYQIGHINAGKFRQQFVKDVEKMYPDVNEASLLEDELGGDLFKKATEIWKKSEECPGLLKKLVEQETVPTAVEKFRKDMKEEYITFVADIITENDKLSTETEDKQTTRDRLKKIRSES